MNIAERIKKIRDLKGWKQDAIAQEMKVTQQAYSCFERGNLPRMETVNRFCDVVKISPAFLLSDIPCTEESLSIYGLMPFSEMLRQLSYYKNQAETLKEVYGSKS